MLHRCLQSWVILWWSQNLPNTLMIISRKEPETILPHGLETTTMVVDVGILCCILHAIQSMGSPGRGTVDSLHLMSIDDIIPCGDHQLYLPEGSLQWVLVLGAVVADGGVQVGEVVVQHVGEESVVVGCLWSWLKVVLALLANLLVLHGGNWGWCRCRGSSRRLLRCSYDRIDRRDN